MPQKSSPQVDIFSLLSEPEKSAEKTKNNVRQELLASTKCKDKDFYPEGTITINKHTCVGVQCKICLKVCPTSALYWTNSGIDVTDELCLHCEACVLCCMVDDCIKVTRKREDGKEEKFSNPKDIAALNRRINAEKRFQRIKDLYGSAEDYTNRHGIKKAT